MSADLAENDIRAKGKWHSRVDAARRLALLTYLKRGALDFHPRE
jgi:hypothetical protein